jgi:transmembrane sensor
MTELILKSLQCRASLQEEARLARWRRASAANEREYQALVRVWGLTEPTSAGVSVPPPPDADALIHRAELEEAARSGGTMDLLGVDRKRPSAAAARRSGARNPRRASWSPWFRVAAILAFLLPAGVFVSHVLNEDRTQQGAWADGEAATGANEMTTITLADGTTIRLGPSSRVQFHRDGADQVAHLEGRAFFGVAHNPSRRFVVRTSHGDAVVLGTRFEVRSEEEEFEVLVVEGSVQVSAGESTERVEGGEATRSAAGAPLEKTIVPDVHEHLAWMGRTLVFQATPLSRVLIEIERKFSVPIQFDRADLADVTITATFTDQDVEDVVRVVCEIVGAECSFIEGTVHVGRADLLAPREIR